MSPSPGWSTGATTASTAIPTAASPWACRCRSGTAIKAASSQAQDQVAAAERALDQLELSLENRLAPVFERYSNALHQVNKYRSLLLPAAQQSLDLVRRLYQAGETPYLNLLTAQRSFSQTNVNYLESLRELRAAEAEIDGLLLTGSLESR